jgi:predicted nuclease of predicted toxin-antitoxin system
MRFLVDQNVPRDVVEGLRDDGHDVTWAQTAHPGADDEILLTRAQQEDRVVLTFDTDFGTLAFHRHLPASSGIILFRLTLVSPPAVAKTVRETIRSRNDWNGHFSVVDDAQIRMRPLPG